MFTLQPSGTLKCCFSNDLLHLSVWPQEKAIVSASFGSFYCFFFSFFFNIKNEALYCSHGAASQSDFSLVIILHTDLLLCCHRSCMYALKFCNSPKILLELIMTHSSLFRILVSSTVYTDPTASFVQLISFSVKVMCKELKWHEQPQ